MIPRRVAATVLCVVAAVGCTQKEKPAAEKAPGKVLLEPESVDEQVVAKGDLPEIETRGLLRILVPPRTEQSLRRPESDVRLERELAGHFAQRFEVDAQIVEVGEYEQLIPELLAGRGDIIAGQMTVTEVRADKVAFTRPVTTISEIVVGQAGVEGLPRSAAELDGKTIHVPEGSAYLETLESIRSDVAPTLNIVEVKSDIDIEQLAYEVSRGERPLTVVDSNRLEVIETYNDALQRLFPIRDGRKLAWAVRPDNPKLKAAADAFLVEVALTAHTREKLIGDLDALRERGSIRLITRNNAMNYYLHRGQHLGFDYELTEMLAEELGLRLEVVVPASRDQLIPFLLEGRGDVIAASLTITPERKRQVAFSAPYLLVDEVLVQRTGGDSPVQTPLDLEGRTIAVRKSSSYYETLEKVRERFGFRLELVPEAIETEVLVAEVAAGDRDLTVADTHILAVQQLIYGNIGGAFAVSDLGKLGPEEDVMAVSDWQIDGRAGDAGGEAIAFAVRPGSKKLLAAIDAFVARHYRGLEYNMLRNRYFANEKRAAEATAERAGATGQLSPYDPLIKEYSEQYGLDWRLMASLAYQESRFDPKARSWVGALGLFQVMPATGRELGFEDLMDPRQATHAGIKYVHQLIEHFEPTIAFDQRVRFALASYNAGFGHVGDARRLAEERGLDPDQWFGNVEQAMLLLQQPRFYKRARYGFVRGREPVKYVTEIQQRYDNYVKVFPR